MIKSYDLKMDYSQVITVWKFIDSGGKLYRTKYLLDLDINQNIPKFNP